MLPGNQTGNQTDADAGFAIDRKMHAIVLTREFAASREQVFAAWTRPEHVKCWWDPTGEPLAECEIDLRPGGAFRFVNRHADGHAGGHAFAGVYREISPPDHLVFEAMEAIGRVTLEKIGGKTRLTVKIECGTAARLEQYLKMGIGDGTAKTLDNLVAHVSKHVSEDVRERAGQVAETMPVP